MPGRNAYEAFIRLEYLHCNVWPAGERINLCVKFIVACLILILRHIIIYVCPKTLTRLDGTWLLMCLVSLIAIKMF